MAMKKYNLPSLQGKIIALDGPAGSGKSTTAKLLARTLGYIYLDTGAMYRALTYFALKIGVQPSDKTKLTALAKKVAIEFKHEDDLTRIFINGEDVTEVIRTPEITQHVSEVSAHPGVRKAIVARQQEIGKNGSIVAEGRDTTTVVFPSADMKVYLDASVKIRAQRRLLDMSKMGITTTLEQQIADIKRRDDYDSKRKHSPLTRAKDAYYVDTTNMTVEEQVDWIINLIKQIIK
ncbi:MAG: (d)CMP kinase [Candidatus Zixiibacteriota bacterium]